MKCYFSVCCILCLMFIPGRLFADPVNPNTAIMAAKSFFDSKSMLRSANNEEPAILRTDKKSDTENYFYVIEAPNKNGWVILAGNDNVTPVIAYSDEGSFSLSSNNKNFEYWMDCMKEEIDYIVRNSTSTLRSSIQSKVKAEWDNLLNQGSLQSKTPNNSLSKYVETTGVPSSTDDVPRLLGDIIWNQQNNFASQGEPPTYNKYTPNNWYVGCVAVAVGQIMKAQLGDRSITGTGSHSYTAPGIGPLSADFGNTTYNFADMPSRIWGITLTNMYVPTDEYGNLFPVQSADTQIDAVAQLLYHIGVACNMGYGATGSGAADISVVSALPDYFKYQTPTLITKTSVTDAVWTSNILTELQSGRPVYYSGQSVKNGGHAFVVDGYRSADQKYHINWGWGGYENGYYALSLTYNDVDSTLAFQNSQEMIIGFNPQPADATVAVTGVTLDQTTATLIAGNTLQLTAAVAPDNATNKKVTWSSSAPAIASVDTTGKVSALTAGTADITVTTLDGNKTAACAVTVNPATVAVTGVTLNLTSDSLNVGSTLQLDATVLPDNATYQSIIWRSSNDSIATVSSNGLVTALAQGTAIVTVSVAADSGNFSATCTITVTWPIVFVSGVTLNLTSDSLTVGSTLQLDATVLPDSATNKKVTWSSSAPAVASVDTTGKVSALTAGTADITVTTLDGNKTAACAVTVNPATVAVTGVTLNQSSLSLWVGENAQLTATVAPANATNRNVSWSSNAPSVATVSNTGLITAAGKGTATITVNTEDGGYKATCTVETLQQEVIIPDSTQTVADGKGNIILSLTVPTDVLFSGSFQLVLPFGIQLDLSATRLIGDLASQLSMNPVQNIGDGSWLFTITPLNMRSATETVYSRIVEIGFIVGESVPAGTYEASIRNLSFTFDNGTSITEDELPVQLTISSQTGILDLTAGTGAYLYNGKLYVYSPVAEKIQVYSVNGKLLYNFKKAEGKATYSINQPKGTALIVKGSSGRIRKVIGK